MAQKSILYIFIASLLLCSCSLDDIMEQNFGNEIAFRPMSGGSATRALQTSIANIKECDLVVTATTEHGETYFKDVVFRNISPESSSPVFVSDTKYYWPGDGSSLNFIAYPQDYVLSGLLNPETQSISYKPQSSWFAEEINIGAGETILPDGTIIDANKTVILPDGETVLPDGTVNFAGNAVLYPDKSLTIEDNIQVTPDRVVTHPDGYVFRTNGVATLPTGEEVYCNGKLKISTGEVISRTDVGTYADGTVVAADGSVTLPSGMVLDPPIAESNNIPFPCGIAFWPNGTIDVYDETELIFRDGEIYFYYGETLYSDGTIWLPSGIEILFCGDINLSDGNVITSSRNFVWANESSDLREHQDLILAHASGSKADIAGVPLSFEHALSQVEIYAKNSNPSYSFEIVSVKLAGVRGDGTLSLQKDAQWEYQTDFYQDYSPKVDYDLRYSTLTESGSGRVKNSIELPLNSTVNLTDPNSYYSTKVVGTHAGNHYGSMMVLPQVLTPWDGSSYSMIGENIGAYIAVKLRIYTAKGAWVYPENTLNSGYDQPYGWVAIPLGGEWKPGKKYVYTLDFSRGAGYSDPQEPDPHLVLNGVFSYSLSVTDWNSQPTQDFSKPI